ncbi:MAG: MFS transporter [Paenibacillaceae bacterium]
MGMTSWLHSHKGTPTDPERRLSREAILTITIHSIFQFGASMAGLFLNLYLWRLTEDLSVNGIYTIISFVMTPIGFAVGGWIAKRKDRLVTYRLGIYMTALFYFIVIIAQENVVNYYILFALVNGFAAGLYWIGYLVLMYDVSTDVNRIRYLGLNMVFFNAAGLLGPVLAGTIIGRAEGLQGYIITFILSFIMFVVAAVVSMRVRMTTMRHKSYYLKLMPLLMRKNTVWLRALFGYLMFGLFQGIMLFLPNILLYQTVGREDLVGYLGVCFSCVIMVTGYMMSRRANDDGAQFYILISSTIVVIGSLFLLYDVRLWTVVVFMVLFSISNPLALNTINSYYYLLIGTLPLKGQMRNELVVMRETFMNIGRVISVTLLLIFSQDLQSHWLPIVLLCTALMQYSIFFLLAKPKTHK